MTDKLITFTLTVGNMERFTDKLEKLQRQAKKYDFFQPKVIDDKVYQAEVWENHIKLKRTYHDITLQYEPMQLAGYTFIARIDGIENIIYTAPAQQLPESQRHFGMNCDHCNINRLRHSVYILQDKDGNYKRVGGNCLAVYVGIDAGSVLAMSTMFDDIADLTQDDELRTYAGQKQYDLGFTLAASYYVINQFGYTSSLKARENNRIATKSTVLDILIDTNEQLAKEFKVARIDGETPTEDSPYIKACIKWMLSLEGSDNDYLCNLANIAKNDYCTYNSLGFAVSAINAYQKHLDDTTAKQVKIATSTSQFVGKVGDKYTAKSPLIVTCTHRSTPFESSFGHRTISRQYYTFTDNNGNEFSTCTESHKCATGDKLSLTGTIESHQINKYTQVPQTILTRCRFTHIENE